MPEPIREYYALWGRMNFAFINEVGVNRWLMRTAVRQFYKRVAQRDHFMILPTGERMLMPRSSRFATEAFVTGGDVDWGSEALLFALIPTGGVFLDVGANIGYYSLYMLPRVRRVYAFEPDPRVRIELKRVTSARNGIEIVSAAVGQSNGKVMFRLEPNCEVSHIAEGSATGAATDIEVDMVSVDSFVSERGLKDVAAIKIDVEGFDYFVVAGSVTVMNASRPLILTEAKLENRLLEIADRTRYEICAYVRSPKQRRCTFRRLSRDDVGRVHTKMLLMLPFERLEEVQSLAGGIHAGSVRGRSSNNPV